MSLDLYVQWFDDGEADAVDEARVREAFGDAVSVEDDRWRLIYGLAVESDLYLSVRDHRVEGLTINRPVESAALWRALFELLGLGNAVFYFPGGQPFVRSAAAAAHLPDDMVKALGPPQVVTSASDLQRAVRAT